MRFNAKIHFAGLIALSTLALASVPSDMASAHPKGLLFPIVGGGTYSNDFDGSRASGKHNATDIFAPKMTRIVAAVGGTVTFVPTNQPSYGFIVQVRDGDGFEYNYIHINNDNPGTDDGAGGAFYAYAPDIYQGAPVEKGQLLGYVGDSGNAETTPPHLHFEIYTPDDQAVNPYPYLLEAQRAGAPVVYPARRNEKLPYGPSINTLPSIALGRFANNQPNQLLISTGVGYAPHIRVLAPNAQDELFGFYAYAQSFTGGVNVAAGDVDGDGVDEIITGTASGAPHVRALKADGTEVAGFYAYAPDFLGGADVAAGDVGGDSKAEIVTSPGPGGSAHIRIFNQSGAPLNGGVNAYGSSTAGARVSVGNVRTSSAKSEIVTSQWSSGSPQMRMFDVNGGALAEYTYYDSWWRGSYEVAAGEGISYFTIGGNRRSSIVEALR